MKKTVIAGMHESAGIQAPTKEEMDPVHLKVIQEAREIFANFQPEDPADHERLQELYPFDMFMNAYNGTMTHSLLSEWVDLRGSEFTDENNERDEGEEPFSRKPWTEKDKELVRQYLERVHTIEDDAKFHEEWLAAVPQSFSEPATEAVREFLGEPRAVVEVFPHEGGFAFTYSGVVQGHNPYVQKDGTPFPTKFMARDAAQTPNNQNISEVPLG